MTRPGLVTALALATAAVPAARAFAQQAVTVRGAVVAAEDGGRVPFAVVLLEPGFTRRFAEADGAFVFTGVAPGRYHLSIRQVGFLPFDTTLAVTPATPPLRLELRRIAVSITAITISATGPCTRPGIPDRAADAQLADIFQQLRQNAERTRLLEDQYPFRYRLVRRLAVQEAGGGERATTDTLELLSTSRWRYTPGEVVTPDPEVFDSRIVHLPVLADLADSAFHANHCFRLAGLDALEPDGPALVRLDWRAAQRLRDPDVDGSAWFDPETFQVRAIRVALTRLDRAARGVTEWAATTTFREVVANVAVPVAVSAVTAYDTRHYVGRGRADVGRTEDQRLLDVRFLRAPPAAAPRDSTPQR